MRAILAALFLALPAAAQWREAKPEEIPALFKADVRQVRVDVEVTEGKRPVNGLTGESFVVRDNGVIQRLAGFAREEVPLDLTLLIDISGSMRESVARVAEAAREAFRVLRQGDRASVMVFNTRTEMALDLTGDLAAVERVLNGRVLEMEFGGGTHILKAAQESGRRFLTLPRGGRRRAALMITDNQGQKAGPNEDQAVETLWEADAVFSALIVNSAGDQARRTAGGILNPAGTLLGLALRAGIDGVAERTGGDVVRAEDVRRDFPALVERLRNRYSLYYAMPKVAPGERRRVTVELAAGARRAYPQAEVMARKGYRAPVEESTP